MRTEDRGQRTEDRALADQLSRIENAFRIIRALDLTPLSFDGSALREMPVVRVKAHPRLYMYLGSYERRSYRQDGATRRETYEADDHGIGVRFVWEEEIKCGT